MSRRHVLGVVAAFGATVATFPSFGRAAGPPPNNGLIDVHAHIVPDFFVEAAKAAGRGQPNGMPGYPPWDEAAALAMMNRQGIQAAIVSPPATNFGDDIAARALARRVNVLAGEMKARRPDRFGFLIALPLPDVAGTLAEIANGFDSLHADGVVMDSNSAGIYPGDAAFDPIFAELDRRGAVLFIHPTSPSCPVCTKAPGQGVPAPVLEFMFETTRVVANLVTSRTLDRFPNIKIIIPHAGAALPALADRLAFATPGLAPGLGVSPQDFFRAYGRFYYDLAGNPLPRALPALRSFAAPDRLLYGSDWPWTPEQAVPGQRGQLTAALASEPDFSRGVFGGNALKLFPRFATPMRPTSG
jgi:predicted TIM-barrel fold metal-dependent hydrolase